MVPLTAGGAGAPDRNERDTANQPRRGTERGQDRRLSFFV